MTRPRILLPLLGAWAILATWGWSTARRNGRPTSGALRQAGSPRLPARGQGAPPRAPFDTSPGTWQPMGDSAFAAVMTSFVIMTVDGDSAYFDFAGAEDSSVSLADFGFVPARSLLDTNARFESVAEGGIARVVGITSPWVVDSAVRYMDNTCSLGVQVPVRDRATGWEHPGPAFMPGMAEMVPGAKWRLRGNDADRALAIALARDFPAADGEGAAESGAGAAEPSAPLFRVRRVLRFVADGTEFLIGDIHSSELRPGVQGPGHSYRYDGQRLFIAERRPDAPTGAFRVAWRHRDAEDGEGRGVIDPRLLLRLGPGRVLTIVFDASYGDGGGDLYLARVAPGEWRHIATTYSGC